MRIDLFYELAVPTESGRTEAQVFDESLDEITLAERLGFHGVWLVEHHFTREYSHSSSPELFLAAASQRTKALRLGHAVAVLPYHHPLHVAERAAVLDLLSGGRLELGIGRGFSPSEYEIFGVQMRDSRDYVQESLSILRQAPDGPFSHQGRLFKFQDVDVLPKPLQRPHPPLWTAAVSPDTFTWAAREGIGALAGPFKPWSLIKQDLSAYRRAWRQQHGTGTLTPGYNSRFALTIGVLCLEDGEEARRLGAQAFTWYYRRLLEQTRPVLQAMQQTYEYYRGLRHLHWLLQHTISLTLLEKTGMVVLGNPEACAKRFAAFERAGVDHLICAIGAGALPTSIVRRCLRVMSEHLLPQFNT